MDDYCDSQDVQRHTDPRFLYDMNEPEKKLPEVRRLMWKYEHYEHFIVAEHFFYFTRRIDHMQTWNHMWMNREMYGTSAYYMTTWAYMKDLCKEKYP